MSGFELTVRHGSFKSTVKDTVDGYAQAPQDQWSMPKPGLNFAVQRVERATGQTCECKQRPAQTLFFIGAALPYARPRSIDVSYDTRSAHIALCEFCIAQCVHGDRVTVPSDSKAIAALNGVMTVDSARTVEPQPQRGKDPRVNGGM